MTKIMGIDATLVKTITNDIGVRYDLYDGANAVVVTDVDTGNVVTIRRYKTFEDAELALAEAAIF